VIKKIRGNSERPRLKVFRSLKHIYAQIIDDTKFHTLVSASTLSKEIKDKLSGKTKTQKAELVGELLGKKAIDMGIKRIIFDRGKYKYHGRIKALADSLRKAGMEF